MNQNNTLRYVGGPLHGSLYTIEKGERLPRRIVCPTGVYLLRGATLEWRAVK